MQFEYTIKELSRVADDMKYSNAHDDQENFEKDLRIFRKIVRHLGEQVREEHEDSAFFEGELEEKEEYKQEPFAHVKKEDGCDHVEEFRNRRQKRKDSKCIDSFKKRRQDRLDAKEDEDGRWVTTEENHKIHLNENGVPDKGNPHVIQAMASGDREGYERRRSKRRIAKAKEIATRLEDANVKLRQAKRESERAKHLVDIAERTDRRIERARQRLKDNGIKDGDGERLRKERDGLKEQRDEMSYRSSADLSYRDAHREELKEIEGKLNNLNFMLSEYETAFDEHGFDHIFPDKVRVTGEEARERLDKAEKAEKEASDRYDKARDELRNVGHKAEDAKIYTSEERKQVVDEISSSDAFSGMTDTGKEKLKQEIEQMSDAQLSILKKTMGGVKISNSNGFLSPSGSTAWYTPGTGSISMSSEDMESPRIAFHEYGHYLDDPKMSNCDMGEGDFGYDGSEYRKSLTDEVKRRKILHGSEARSDLQNLVGEKTKVVGSDSGDILWLENENGEADDWKEYDKLSRVVCDKFSSFIREDKEFEDYCHSIGMPMESERPNHDDYYEIYKTPKRGLVRTREKFKGAEEKYREVLNDFYDRHDKAWKEHGDEYLQKLKEYNDRCENRERQVAPVSDIMCGMMRGKGPWVYGSHTEDYYKYMEKPANEAVANYHQMRSMGWKDGIGLLKSLVPSVAKGLEEVYDEWLWRNLDET